MSGDALTDEERFKRSRLMFAKEWQDRAALWAEWARDARDGNRRRLRGFDKLSFAAAHCAARARKIMGIDT